MLGKEMLLRQFEYNGWANGRILERTAELENAELIRPPRMEGRSILQILVHLTQIEKVWRLLVQDGRFDPQEMLGPEKLSTIDQIQVALISEHTAILDLLSQLDDADLVETLTVSRWDGMRLDLARWQMLCHLLLHSMQHRSEAAVALSERGLSPGDIDFLFFLSP